MYLEPYADIDEPYENPPTLITIVKDGPVSAERAFDLYSALTGTPANSRFVPSSNTHTWVTHRAR